MRRTLGLLCFLFFTLSGGFLPTGAQPPGDIYADRVVSFSSGNPANPAFGDPDSALGPPDFSADAPSGFLTLGVAGHSHGERAGAVAQMDISQFYITCASPPNRLPARARE